jgi:outer membrane protein
MSKFVPLIGATLLATLFAARVSHAAQPERTQPRGWLIGAGYVMAPNPFVADVDTVSAPIPLIGYTGERLTWLGPYLSYEVVGAGRASVAAVIEARFEGIPEDIEEGPLAGLNARKPTLDAGAGLAYGRFLGSVRAEVSGRHDGYELSLSAGDERHVGETWIFRGRIGATWQSADLTSYLYGIDVTEARPGLVAYEPQEALNFEATLLASYRISAHWTALGSVAFRLLDDEISSSPIVAQDHDVGGFAALVYQFGHP